MIDFPASPTIGQQFSAAGVVWTWDGTKWLPSGLSPTVVPGINDNRIINGDFRIDQRNGGASGSASGYTIDRWQFSTTQVGRVYWQQNSSGSSIIYQGFPYYLGLTTISAYTVSATDYFAVMQTIEADMVSDFAWGTANAQPVTLSFLARSSIIGSFSGSIRNAGSTRAYPFSFNLPAANTWTNIVITIPGDTAGTWVMSGNAASLIVNFDVGSGANFRAATGGWQGGGFIGVTGSASIVATANAKFYVTGVKLEIGSVATPYNRQSLAKSMVDCQRYYQIYGSLNASGYNAAGSVAYGNYIIPAMRAAPTVVFSNQGYLNASAMVTNNVDAVSLRTQITVTAVGFGSGNTTVALSAEL